ncbi:MAG: DNA repair protein RecN [Bdellovibrionota bacterium]
MLTHLNIKGLAIIDELSINFASGFNVITGETGAGKSILIKALNLLLGKKANADIIRKGSTSATAAGVFSLPASHLVIGLVEELGIELEKDRSDNRSCELLIRRTVNDKGRSSAWINDTPITLASLRLIGSNLIDIFGQHESTKILDPSQHTRYLDQFLKNKKIASEFKAVYHDVVASLKEIRRAVANYEKNIRNQDYLSFRFEELCELNPSKDDYRHMQESCKNVEHSVLLKENISASQEQIDRGANGSSLASVLWKVSQRLANVSTYSKEYEELSVSAASVASLIEDLSFDLDRLGSQLDFSEEDLEFNQSRLSQYQDFFRKLGVADVEGLIVEKDKLANELALIDSASNYIIEGLQILCELLQRLRASADILTQERKKAAINIKKRVEKEFNDLAMPGAKFDVRFEPVQSTLTDLDLTAFGSEAQDKWGEVCEALSEINEHGGERVNFMLSSNPGEPSLPIQKIASGGEVSRIMLALKKALAAGANTCILVFDEIDSGISGRVASMVGKKMRELAREFQIISISHLAQVAACADEHFLVHKFGDKNRTKSKISHLSPEKSMEEIARLLSGDKINKLSLANAKSLVEKARGAKA